MPDTLGETLTDHYAAAGKGRPNQRALASLNMPRTESEERLAELRRRDPAAFDALPASVRLQHAYYTEARQALAEAFRWDSTLELQLEQRAEGATFYAEISKALDVYAEARAITEAAGLLEAARKAAEKGANRS